MLFAWSMVSVCLRMTYVQQCGVFLSRSASSTPGACSKCCAGVESNTGGWMGHPSTHAQRMRGRSIKQKLQSGLRKAAGFATAGVVAVGFTVAGSAPASADDGEHRSHAYGQLINLDALGFDLADAGSAEQHYLAYPGSADVGTVDAQLVEELINLNIGGTSLPILPEGLTVGAVSSYAHTPEPEGSVASAGSCQGE